jgi:hypothetical protein
MVGRLSPRSAWKKQEKLRNRLCMKRNCASLNYFNETGA